MKMIKQISAILGVLILAASNPSLVKAQEIDAVTRVVEVNRNNDVDFSEMNTHLKNIEDSLKRGNIAQDETKNSSAYLATAENTLLEKKKQLEREEKFVQRRIEALGETPKDGDRELEIITEKREEFAQEMALQKAKIAEVDILLAKIYELNTLIINAHNKILLGNLMMKHEPLLYPQNLYASTKMFVSFILNIFEAPAKWYKLSNVQMKKSVILAALFAFLAIFVGFYLKRFIYGRWGYRDEIQNPSYEQKVLAAIHVALARGIIPSFILGGLLVWTISIGAFSGGFLGIVVASVLYYMLYIVICTALARVIFAPKRPQWRLANIDTQKAKKLTYACYWSIFLIFGCMCVENIANRTNYPIELLYFLSALSTGIKAFCLVLVVNALLWKKEDEAVETDTDDETDNGLSLAWKVTFSVSLFSIGIFILALLGYSQLSSYILSRLLISAILLGVFIVIKTVMFDVLKKLLMFVVMKVNKKLKKKIFANLDIVQSVVITPLLIILLILAILNVWGVPTDVLMFAVKKLLFGFRIGDFEISLVSILLGILSFCVSIYVFKLITAKTRQNILAKISIDDGIKNSLLTAFSFLGTIVSALIAVVIMGVDLTNLALIAGALSIGIGFGLQNIINNLVSGLIILFERPFKVGDWVIIDGEEGKIKQINIRSTEVETFKRSSVIIPNANLLSSSVTNLTHGDNLARYSVKVGVAYGTDVEKVKQILLECAAKNKNVLKTPAPYVMFQDFGASSLDFELRFYVNDIWAGWMVPSDLRYVINQRFIEENIEIPFQQIVIHKAEN